MNSDVPLGGDSDCCPICCEDYEFSSASALEEGPSSIPRIQSELLCGHSFCYQCLVRYLQESIDHKNIRFECPDSNCLQPIPKCTQKRLLATYSPRHWRIWRRLQRKAQNPNLVDCPLCNKLTDGTPGNEITCSYCRGAFCRIHGAAHPNISCEEFSSRPIDAATRLTEETLVKLTKGCTRCGARMQRSAGCDYVVCGNCRGDFCWKCGTHDHMQGEKQRECTRCRSTWNNTEDPGCKVRLGLTVLMALICIMWPVLALVFLICSGCHCCCFWGFRVDPDGPRQPRRAICAIIIIIFFPLLLLLESVYLLWKENSDGFLAPILPPSWNSFTDEIPFHNTNTEAEESTSHVDQSLSSD